MRLEDLMPEKFLNMLNDEARAQLEDTVAKAQETHELLEAHGAEATVDQDQEGLYLLVTSPEDLSDEVKEKVVANSPTGRAKFQNMLLPSTVQKLMLSFESGYIEDFAIFGRKDDMRHLVISARRVEGPEYTEGYTEALIKVVEHVLSQDKFPQAWSLVLDNETIYESKPSISEEDIEALREKLENAQSVDDVLNSL